MRTNAADQARQPGHVHLIEHGMGPVPAILIGSVAPFLVCYKLCCVLEIVCRGTAYWRCEGVCYLASTFRLSSVHRKSALCDWNRS